ncbi:MAG: ATP-binding cassette domain-containing protein [Desulfobacterales bacterium]|nr:MAG: ATP-binding cassette domain-containing protein [Desulfobacterales bacterium]
MAKEPLIEFQGVTKRFDTRTILDRVNLKIYEGDVTTIIGMSGTGKSVLLKHIIGLLKADAGHILFRGQPIDQMSKREWNAYIGQISYMFQNNALFDSLTVYENVALPLRQTTKLGKRQIEAKAMARIEQAELTEVAHKYPSEISGGMQKRTALARALVTDPQIVLFDEPTTGQDPVRKNAILGMVAEYQKKLRFTAVLISHDIPDVFFISNRILALYDKRIVFQGTPEEFDEFQHPFHDELIRSFEGLQEELTGLYSKRHFKVRYQTDLAKSDRQQTYAVLVFTLENMDSIAANLGHSAAQQVIRSLGAFINKHFGAVGGFSSRQTINEFGTILPFSDLQEAEQILEDFTRDFQEHGIHDLGAAAQAEMTAGQCSEFSVLAGLAQGRPQIELESVFEFARFNQKPIATFRCEQRGEAP